MITALLVAAVVLAFVEELQANGRSLVAWAVILIGIVLLAGRIP